MIQLIKKVLPKETTKFLSGQYQVAKWLKNGRPSPPPKIIKQKMVKELAKKYNCKILVETGTYAGDMVFAQLNNFDRIFSIELSSDLYNKVQKRFIDQKHVELLNGDSAIKLNELINKLKAKTLFWLDAHYSGGITALGDQVTPIYEELLIIFKNNFDHIILIDDARLFVGNGGYPALNDLISFIKEHDNNYKIEVKNDIIILTK